MEATPSRFDHQSQGAPAVQTPRVPTDACVQGNLVLIGYMGTGKSSVGRQLARFAHMRFVDTDDLIVAAAGRTIPEIFAAEGVDHFRQLETQVLRDLAGSAATVVATGGGIVTRPENLPLLRALGTIVWLTASEDVIFERVSRNRNRPLLQTENPRETMHQLLTERLPLYRQNSDIVADTSWMSQGDVAHAILMEARRRQSGAYHVAHGPAQS